MLEIYFFASWPSQARTKKEDISYSSGSKPESGGPKQWKTFTILVNLVAHSSQWNLASIIFVGPKLVFSGSGPAGPC